MECEIAAGLTTTAGHRGWIGQHFALCIALGNQGIGAQKVQLGPARADSSHATT